MIQNIIFPGWFPWAVNFVFTPFWFIFAVITALISVWKGPHDSL